MHAGAGGPTVGGGGHKDALEVRDNYVLLRSKRFFIILLKHAVNYSCQVNNLLHVAFEDSGIFFTRLLVSVLYVRLVIRGSFTTCK